MPTTRSAATTKQCPICAPAQPGREVGRQVATIDGHPLNRCPGCGLQFFDPQPDDQSLATNQAGMEDDEPALLWPIKFEANPHALVTPIFRSLHRLSPPFLRTNEVSGFRSANCLPRRRSRRRWKVARVVLYRRFLTSELCPTRPRPDIAARRDTNPKRKRGNRLWPSLTLRVSVRTDRVGYNDSTVARRSRHESRDWGRRAEH